MSIETISTSSAHFEERHDKSGEIICMQHDERCSVLVEISDASESEQRILASAAEKALTRLDKFFDGKFADYFSGLHIKIGDNLTESGAEARANENAIRADRQKMLLSLAEAEARLINEGYFDQGERTRVVNADEAMLPGSSLEYELIHEVGHLLDEQTPGNVRNRVSAQESPTKYGREPDKWHPNKEHEAFAEGFAYMVYGMEVTTAMRSAVLATIEARKHGTEKSD